jgi:predicted deacylase
LLNRSSLAVALAQYLILFLAASFCTTQAQDFPVDTQQIQPPLKTSEKVLKNQPNALPPDASAHTPTDEIEKTPVAEPIKDKTPVATSPPAIKPVLATGDKSRSNSPSEEKGTILLLGETIASGTRRELQWTVGKSFDGNTINTPVIVIHGRKPGPRLCLTAAVHGDELNGIEVVRRIANDLNPKSLTGTLVAVPVVNLMGFSRGSRYLPDRRDLNRVFPGSESGSAASRIAHSLFSQIIRHCDALIDFHTGSFDRSNLPQVRGDLTLPNVLEFTRGFGAAPVLHSPGARGMLRMAATDKNIPAVTFEVGAPGSIEPEKIDFAAQTIASVMHHMGMTRSFRMWSESQATFYESKWVRVDEGGILQSTVSLGDRVRIGQRLGKVVDPLRNDEHEVRSPHKGLVIGIALNQLVLPGYAAYHIGIETSEQQAVHEAQQIPVSPEQAIERMEGDELRQPIRENLPDNIDPEEAKGDNSE